MLSYVFTPGDSLRIIKMANQFNSILSVELLWVGGGSVKKILQNHRNVITELAVHKCVKWNSL